MATTNSGFVTYDNAALVGSTVGAAGQVNALAGHQCNQQVEEGFAVRLDLPGPRPQDSATVPFDLAQAGYAKNAGVQLTFTGTTPITLDFTALAATTGVAVAGDSTFANYGAIVLTNNGASGNVAVTLGASDPLRTSLSGTGPTVTLLPGDVYAYSSATQLVVDSTHKTLTFTPTAGGSLGVAIGGS